MKNEITNRILKKHSEQCHTSALAYIEIVTNIAIAQMKLDQCTFAEITPDMIGHFAAKSLGVEEERLIPEIISMMVFEGLVEIVRDIHYPEGS